MFHSPSDLALALRSSMMRGWLAQRSSPVPMAASTTASALQQGGDGASVRQRQRQRWTRANWSGGLRDAVLLHKASDDVQRLLCSVADAIADLRKVSAGCCSICKIEGGTDGGASDAASLGRRRENSQRWGSGRTWSKVCVCAALRFASRRGNDKLIECTQAGENKETLDRGYRSGSEGWMMMKMKMQKKKKKKVSQPHHSMTSRSLSAAGPSSRGSFHSPSLPPLGPGD